MYRFPSTSQTYAFGVATAWVLGVAVILRENIRAWRRASTERARSVMRSVIVRADAVADNLITYPFGGLLNTVDATRFGLSSHSFTPEGRRSFRQLVFHP